MTSRETSKKGQVDRPFNSTARNHFLKSRGLHARNSIVNKSIKTREGCLSQKSLEYQNEGLDFDPNSINSGTLVLS